MVLPLLASTAQAAPWVRNAEVSGKYRGVDHYREVLESDPHRRGGQMGSLPGG